MNNQDIIIGTIKGPSDKPNEYSFITSDNDNSKIGEFIYYLTSDGYKISGTITDKKIVKCLPNTFLVDKSVNPKEISELIEPNSSLQEIYEVIFVINGYFDKNLNCFINPRIPPNHGDKIYLVSDTDLTSIISSKPQNSPGSARIGNLLTRLNSDVPVILNIKNLVSTHLAVLASTGSGKSYTVGVLIEEMMQYYNKASVLIIDPHNEYDTLSQLETIPEFKNGNYSPKVKVLPPDKVNVRVSSLTEYDIKYLLPNLSDKMDLYLSQAYKNATRGKNNDEEDGYHWGMSDLIQQLNILKEDDPKIEGTIDALCWRLNYRINNSKVFSNTKHLPLKEVFKPGQCTVLQMSEIDQTEQQVILATILRRINKARMDTHKGLITDPNSENYIPYPVFIIIEEAHRFAPANAPSVATNILKTILSEGRKFGVGVGLVTQRPGKIEADILSQCMTQMIMKIINPIDQNTIASSIESAGSQLLKELASLTRGQVIISGAAVNIPVLCNVRKRITQHGGETIDAPSIWLDYYSDNKVKNRVIESSILKSTDKSEKLDGFSI